MAVLFLLSCTELCIWVEKMRGCCLTRTRSLDSSRGSIYRELWYGGTPTRQIGPSCTLKEPQKPLLDRLRFGSKTDGTMMMGKREVVCVVWWYHSTCNLLVVWIDTVGVPYCSTMGRVRRSCEKQKGSFTLPYHKTASCEKYHCYSTIMYRLFSLKPDWLVASTVRFQPLQYQYVNLRWRGISLTIIRDVPELNHNGAICSHRKVDSWSKGQMRHKVRISKGPKVERTEGRKDWRSKGPKVQRSKGPKVQRPWVITCSCKFLDS